MVEAAVEATKPQLTLLTSKKEAFVGSEVTVDCQAEGIPDPYVTWSRDGKPVYESETVSLAPNGSLIIHKVHVVGGALKQSNVRLFLPCVCVCVCVCIRVCACVHVRGCVYVHVSDPSIPAIQGSLLDTPVSCPTSAAH